MLLDQIIFFFDGRQYQSLTLGYSASHSSCYSNIYKITLVKKGENGAPEEGGYINFSPYEKSAGCMGMGKSMSVNLGFLICRVLEN